METIEERTIGTLTIRILPDYDPPDPRQDCNVGTMLTWHRNYSLGDVQERRSTDDFYDGQRFWGYGTMRNYLIAEHDALPDTVQPLYLFDHSGLSMSTDTATFAAADSAGWDWGCVGVIFATQAALDETGCPTDRIAEALTGEVDTYDRYLRGEFCGYVVEDAAGGVLDSCWGFEDAEYAMAEALDAVEYAPEYRREVVGAFAGSEGMGL